MRWAEYVARMGTEDVLKEFWWGDLTERNLLEDRNLIGG